MRCLETSSPGVEEGAGQWNPLSSARMNPADKINQAS